VSEYANSLYSVGKYMGLRSATHAIDTRHGAR